MTSRYRRLGKLLGPVQRRLARVDLREHEDKILLLLALVISAVVGLIVVAFVAVTERHRSAYGHWEVHLLFHFPG